MSTPNNFLWYELMTSDTAAAGDFYSHVVGWNTGDGSTPRNPYTLFRIGDQGVGGMMELPKEACDQGAEPGWIGYIAVGDVDAEAKRVVAAGGSVLRDPDDVPGMLRFAVVADPHGTPFVIFRGFGGEMPQFPSGTPGTVGWHELNGGDVGSAFAFYSSLFGWTKDQAMDMGEGEVYQLFAAGSEPVGAMMKCRNGAGPHWTFYFCVDDIDYAIARIGTKGGKVVDGPHQVPGEAWIIHALDPQGASFALVGPRS